MDKQILEQFYKQMNEPEQFATALSVKSMLDELPVYRIDRIVDHFKNNCYPFESVWNWNNKAAVIFFRKTSNNKICYAIHQSLHD